MKQCYAVEVKIALAICFCLWYAVGTKKGGPLSARAKRDLFPVPAAWTARLSVLTWAARLSVRVWEAPRGMNA